MMVTELSTVSEAQLPMQAMKDHLRLGTGFGEDDLQDGLIATGLRAAMAAIEARIGKVLLARDFRLTLSDWRDAGEQALPLAPVSQIGAVVLVDALGARETVAASRYRLVPDQHRPKLAAAGLLLPSVPADGQVEITFQAGFSADWAGVPPDLAQAVLRLAAEYYESRHDPAAAVGLPGPVQVLIERWRTVRVLGGGAAR